MAKYKHKHTGEIVEAIQKFNGMQINDTPAWFAAACQEYESIDSSYIDSSYFVIRYKSGTLESVYPGWFRSNYEPLEKEDLTFEEFDLWVMQLEEETNKKAKLLKYAHMLKEMARDYEAITVNEAFGSLIKALRRDFMAKWE